MNIDWSQELFYNTLRSWCLTFSVVIASFVMITLFKKLVIKAITKWTVKTKTTLDDLVVAVIDKSIVPILYTTSIYFAVCSLRLPQKLVQVSRATMLLIVTFYTLRAATFIAKKLIISVTKRNETYVENSQTAGLAIIANSVIWIVGIIFLIDNFGYNVSTLLAGLGIGGIAIALAAQTILGDLFSYFVIFFDKPFEIGDFIIVDDKMGVVEHIGIKTTRIRTLAGDQLVCSNTFLTNARVHNYKRMEKRRVVFKLGVAYQTPYDKLASIPKIVKHIILSESNVEFDRGHFSGYGSFSLDFEFVYYIDSPEYNLYMDKQQEVYLKIFSAFEESGIEFAYPTQTLYIQPNYAKSRI